MLLICINVFASRLQAALAVQYQRPLVRRCFCRHHEHRHPVVTPRSFVPGGRLAARPASKGGEKAARRRSGALTPSTRHALLLSLSALQPSTFRLTLQQVSITQRHFHGSGRVMATHPARSMRFGNLLTLPDPTREISNTSRPEPTRPDLIRDYLKTSRPDPRVRVSGYDPRQAQPSNASWTQESAKIVQHNDAFSTGHCKKQLGCWGKICMRPACIVGRRTTPGVRHDDISTCRTCFLHGWRRRGGRLGLGGRGTEGGRTHLLLALVS